MNPAAENSALPLPASANFDERRRVLPTSMSPSIERRQFGNTHHEISDEARELGQAIDQYKLMHRRRFITYEEMLSVIKELGYQKSL